MTQVVRLLGHFANGGAGSLDITCRTASAIVPSAQRFVGADGTPSLISYPSVILLQEVRPDSLEALQRRAWSHIVWTTSPDGQARELAIQEVIVSDHDVRVLV